MCVRRRRHFVLVLKEILKTALISLEDVVFVIVILHEQFGEMDNGFENLQTSSENTVIVTEIYVLFCIANI